MLRSTMAGVLATIVFGPLNAFADTVGVPDPVDPKIWKCTDGGKTSYLIRKGDTEGRQCEVFVAEWWPLSWSDKYIVYYNPRTLAKENGQIKMWFLWNYYQAMQTSQYPVKEYRSTKNLAYFKCEARASASLQGVFYSDVNGAGDSVNSYSINKEKVIFEDVIPGTVGEEMLDKTCDMAKQRWAEPKPVVGKKGSTKK